MSLLIPLSLSTDIMVDMPDEQSIVTYVAQFLERFPELDPVRLSPFPSIHKMDIFPGYSRDRHNNPAMARVVWFCC